MFITHGRYGLTGFFNIRTIGASAAKAARPGNSLGAARGTTWPDLSFEIGHSGMASSVQIE
jgi:hypothetical protein